MSADRPPAHEWYNLIVATAAVRGWSIADVAVQSGVARSTVYGWEKNRGRPQAKAVNAVADALGIPREQALRLAGIIGTQGAPDQDIPKSLLREIAGTDGLTPEGRQAVIDSVKRELAKGRGAAEASAPAPAAEPEQRRPAS